MRDLVCERCGTTFTCGHGAPGCWCEHQPPQPGLQQHLSRTYNDCLCPDCLLLEAAAGPAATRID